MCSTTLHGFPANHREGEHLARRMRAKGCGMAGVASVFCVGRKECVHRATGSLLSTIPRRRTASGGGLPKTRWLCSTTGQKPGPELTVHRAERARQNSIGAAPLEPRAPRKFLALAAAGPVENMPRSGAVLASAAASGLDRHAGSASGVTSARRSVVVAMLAGARARAARPFPCAAPPSWLPASHPRPTCQGLPPALPRLTASLWPRTTGAKQASKPRPATRDPVKAPAGAPLGVPTRRLTRRRTCSRRPGRAAARRGSARSAG
jgi:hypothetical protein